MARAQGARAETRGLRRWEGGGGSAEAAWRVAWVAAGRVAAARAVEMGGGGEGGGSEGGVGEGGVS